MTPRQTQAQAQGMGVHAHNVGTGKADVGWSGALSLAWATELVLVSNINKKCLVVVSPYFKVFLVAWKGGSYSAWYLYSLCSTQLWGNLRLWQTYSKTLKDTGSFRCFQRRKWLDMFPGALAFGSLQSQMIRVWPLLLLCLFQASLVMWPVHTARQCASDCLLLGQGKLGLLSRDCIPSLGQFPEPVWDTPEAINAKPFLL